MPPPFAMRPAMTFRDSPSEFLIVDLAAIDPDPSHPRQSIDEASLKGLTNSIEKMGLIHPLIVRPGNQAGRYTVIAGERRRQAAQAAGLSRLPVLVRPCSPEAALEVQVFENLGLGVRAALEPRELALAIRTIAERFEKEEEAARHFGRPANWLNQATAAAKLSEKVTALLDAGKISSTGAALQIEKLAKKDEAKAELLIDQIEQLPEGEKASRKLVDAAVAEAGGRRRKNEDAPPAPALPAEPVATAAAAPNGDDAVPPWAEPSPEQPPAEAPPARARLTPGKVKLVAEILGLDYDDEEAVLARLIDEFLAMKRG